MNTSAPNQSAANRRPAGQSDGLGNLSAIVAADRALPAAVADMSFGESTRMIIKSMGVAFAAVFIIALARLPLLSRWSGDFADITFVMAFQDMPSGIYFDRDFDWPTGEALWVDVPAWSLHLALLCCAVGCVVASVCRKRTPNKPDAVNPAIPSRCHSGDHWRGVTDPTLAG